MYAYHPFDEPIRGRLAIVASWLEGKDPAGTYDGRYEPVAIDDNLAVANGRSRYFKEASKADLVREYNNLFLIELDDHGRCRSFPERYMLTVPNQPSHVFQSPDGFSAFTHGSQLEDFLQAEGSIFKPR